MNDTPLKYRILDYYLKKPILWDLVIGILMSLLALWLVKKDVLMLRHIESLKSLITDLISVTISLAGFILAAITIIVTFKDSIDSTGKTLENAKSGKELFFLSKSYFRSVRVFYYSAIELIVLFILLSLAKVIKIHCEDIYIALCSVFIIAIIVLSVLRSLYLLLAIIKIQAKKN